MQYVIFLAVLAGAYFVGTIGFFQIIGSIQTKQRGFLFTILLWLAILAGVYLLARRFLHKEIFALYMGYIASLVTSLGAGKIE